eukprot:2405849-Lingulodinium_polyedra.AAC.1
MHAAIHSSLRARLAASRRCLSAEAIALATRSDKGSPRAARRSSRRPKLPRGGRTPRPAGCRPPGPAA